MRTTRSNIRTPPRGGCLGSVMVLLSGPAVADAIGDNASALVKLAAAQPNDARLVDDIFARVLNRPATKLEIEKTLTAWKDLDLEHASLIADWEAQENVQVPIIAKMETERVVVIDTAKKELARFEAEIAPKVAEAEKKRVADVAVKAEPQHPATTDYVAMADTKIAGITGALLEVLPSADEPAFGPGRAAGNFVLGEFAVKSGDFKTNPASEVDLAGAIARTRSKSRTARRREGCGLMGKQCWLTASSLATACGCRQTAESGGFV